MAKCVRCGRGGMGVLHRALKLSDKNIICFDCYRQLGGDPSSDASIAYLMHSYDEIKDGFDAMYQRQIDKRMLDADLAEADRFGNTLKHTRQLGKARATDPEKRLNAAICSILKDEGRDVDAIDVALGDNGSLLLMVDGVVFIEYKSDEGVKWIRFANEGPDKIRITGPARVNAMANRVVAAYDAALA